MFKHLTVATLTVLLSTGAFAQTKKKSSKKKAATKTEAPAATPEPTPAPEAAAPKHEAPPPAPVASSNSHNVSEAYWQPSEGQSAVEVGLGYGMATGVESGTRKYNLSILGVPLSYDYGLAGDHSVGLSTAYASLTVKTDPATVDRKWTGLGDLYVNSKNWSALEGGSLLYGGSLGFSTAKHKDATNTEDGNNSTGGMSIPVYVGYQGNTGSGFWGAVLKYTYRMEQTTDNGGGSETKTKNNNVLGLNFFYEGDMDANYWLVHLGYNSIADATNTTGGVDSTSKGRNSVPFGFEYGWLMGNMRLALAYDGVDYMEVDNGAAGKDKSYLSHTLTVDGRWTF